MEKKMPFGYNALHVQAEKSKCPSATLVVCHVNTAKRANEEPMPVLYFL